jgi:hypothetical protein
MLFWYHVQTALETTQLPVNGNLGIFQGVKWPEREADDFPLSSAQVKNKWIILTGVSCYHPISVLKLATISERDEFIVCP